MAYTERVLNDDNPVFWGYWYLKDGEPFQSEIEGSVANLRELMPDVKEFRYCDTITRGLDTI